MNRLFIFVSILVQVLLSHFVTGLVVIKSDHLSVQNNQSKITNNNAKANEPTFKIGVGIADITGPSAEINMMGYAKLGQDTRGIHTRLYSRAVVIVDQQGSRVCYVNVDLAAVTQIVKILVIERLEKKLGEGIYKHENVMIGATHTHSGPGGYFQYLLYIITQEGFIKESVHAIVSGISKSILQAHHNLTPGFIHYNKGLLLNASINRSPASYLQNPAEERAKYKYNTEKLMQILKFTDITGKPIGIASWFAVHGTSMNNSNKLISSDNKGYAAMKMEQDFNGFSNVGKGPFVALFGQANEGDSSPNIKGARCIDTGMACDFVHSTCNNKNELCVAHGPGKDMFESTRLIGELQYAKARQLFDQVAQEELRGHVGYVYQNINMTQRAVHLANGTEVKTCAAALGFSFAAGTTDGEGALFFQQGTKLGQESVMWDYLRNIITNPSKEILECHRPKPVLLPVGEMKFPYDWTPEIMPTQLFEIGNILIVGLPSEFTTMAGRRIREDIEKIFQQKGKQMHVILAGLTNTYSNYVTTYEEYQLQRYEAGSTLFGPYTLDAYREQYRYLTKSLLSRENIPFGPKFPNLLKSELTFKPGVIFDMPVSKHFGEVLNDAFDTYYTGSRVKVRFCGANPRNNMHLGGSYLTVERLINDTHWQVYATDAHWETMFIWHRNNTFMGTSEVTIIWDIPHSTPPGVYRIHYFGDSKSFLQKIEEFTGTTRPFKVLPLAESRSVFSSFLRRSLNNDHDHHQVPQQQQLLSSLSAY